MTKAAVVVLLCNIRNVHSILALSVNRMMHMFTGWRGYKRCKEKPHLLHFVWATLEWNYTVQQSIIFTALHGMQTRSSDENSVCLYVCPSVCQTRALWQNGRKLCLDFYMIRKIIYPSFLRKRMFGGGRPLLPEILGQPARVGAKSPILNR